MLMSRDVSEKGVSGDVRGGWYEHSMCHWEVLEGPLTLDEARGESRGWIRLESLDLIHRPRYVLSK